MTAERWERLKDLFEAALEREEAERAAFLERACAGDPQLHAEAAELLRNHEQAGSFLDHSIPSGPTRSLQIGQILAGRFEVLRFLGQGGMGEVYEAEDRSLGTRVALKTLRVDADPEGEARLLREIRHARKVTHPNVCRVFDLGSDRGPQGTILFLTMELLDGDTLAARLKRDGPLTAAEAMTLAEQMAAALDAAHHAGLIHRDFKTGNVMLVRDPALALRAVVTDFGLARPSAGAGGDASVTGTGMLLGTPAYMAPELFRGAESSVASDVYAFGVVLFEMITGRRPGAEKDSDGVPPFFTSVIGRCLSSDPAQRWTSAGASITALKEGTRARPFLRKRAVAATALLVLLALSLAVFRLFPWRQTVREGFTVMVADVANSTGDSSLDGITVALASQLSQSGRFDLWDTNRRPGLLGRMAKPEAQQLTGEVAREAALREGVPYVLFTGIAPLGDGLVFSLRLEEIEARSTFLRHKWTHSINVDSKNGLLDALHEASQWLRKNVGEQPAELAQHDRLPQDTTTRSWEALAMFSRAEDLKARDASDQAVSILREALRIDPLFATAHARLGDILMSLGRRREGLAEWQSAVDQRLRQHLTRREELRIRSVYGIDSGDLQAAEAALLLWSQDYPRDHLPLFYLGYVYRMQMRLPESLRVLRSAEAMRPDAFYVVASLIRTSLAANDYGAALESCARLRQLNHGDTADKFEATVRLLRGDSAGAVEMFSRMASSADPLAQSSGLLLLARAEAERGRPNEAADALRRGIEFDRSSTRNAARARKLLGLAYLGAGDVRSLALEAVQLDASPEVCLTAGTILARSGLRREAASVLDRLEIPEGAPTFEAMKLRLQGEIALSAGLLKEALGAFEKASALEPPLAPRDYLARALERAGQFERARGLYQEVLNRPGMLWQDAATALPGALREVERVYRSTAVHIPKNQKGPTQ